MALESCESGSISQIAVLDSIAQARLQRGDLAGCGVLLNQIEGMSSKDPQSKFGYYQAWARQTRIQLLLRKGQYREARQAIDGLKPRYDDITQSRITTVSYLRAAETLVATSEPGEAARMLCAVLIPAGQIAPDLYAEMERVTAKALSFSGSQDDARRHLARSIRTFEAIGHSIGHSAALADLALLPSSLSPQILASGTRKSLDHIRALIDTRARPELFGREAILFLDELECAEGATLSVEGQSTVPTSMGQPDASFDTSATVCIQLGTASNGRVSLSFRPRSDPGSIVSALEFQRVIQQIIAIRPPESVLAELDVVWAANDRCSPEGVVFAAESMLAIMKTVKKIAATDIGVLITGETGAGKEIIAKSIHDQSARAGMPFIALNCAAVPKELLESQLFGYKKGAFSGDSEPFQGVVKAANGGTLLLDEIGELPIDAQAKLLRFLEVGEVHQLGEAYPTKVNVRVLFATNENLETAVKEKRFREDLFYRLNVIPIRIPPLRERREEIPLLVSVFSNRFAREFSKEAAKFEASAMECLVLYSWPGNVRQLANEIRRITALMESGAYVTPDVLSAEIATTLKVNRPTVADSAGINVSLDQTLENATADLERQMVEYALKRAHGRVTDAANKLGLSRKGLYLKRRRLGLANATHLESPT
jgi:DNA-binding NtrC family response regulator